MNKFLKTAYQYRFTAGQCAACIMMLSLSISLTACSTTKALVGRVWQDRGEAYATAEEYPTLQIPQGIAKGTTADTYCIPKGPCEQ